MTANHSADRLLGAFLSNRSRMERSVARRVGCRAMAADLVQDLFLRLWQRPQGGGRDDPRYLMRSAHNIAIDHLRSAGHRAETQALSQALADRHPAPDEAMAARQQLRVIEATLEALPPRTRQAFLLHRVDGQACPAIARTLRVSIATVERDIARALLACRAAVRRERAPR
jgi:RNA polymerase sigma factor (sigma-70 family)